MDNIREILQSVEGSEDSVADQSVELVEEGINVVGNVERVRFVFEDDHESGEGETDENEPRNGLGCLLLLGRWMEGSGKSWVRWWIGEDG
nr:hypothetical protein [Tanacetum cinerariifolium]